MIVDLGKARIFLRLRTTDLRKAVNGLSAIVQNDIKQYPFSDSAFLFCNRERKLLKSVYWDKTCFWLSQKRLEKNRFPWLADKNEARELTADELRMLFAGIDFFKVHKEVFCKKVI
ncbi:MAG: IS66 family insertion sequence element accessory protein TnpB [Treponema sp.]|nr:IS66 family insertion sequence element accessory protein TnpB [Treponema sp.]